MKVLNLDGFAQVKRQLELKGVSYDVLETSIQQFIDNLAAAEALESEGEKTPETLSRQVRVSVDAILESVPTMPRDQLMKLPTEALTAIMKFIRGELDPQAPVADTDKPKEDGEGGEQKKD